MATKENNETEQVEQQADELGASEVQTAVDEEQEKGYRGVVADKTPNHAYTVAGVTANEPTPENQKGVDADK